jgi:hypothetical protein
LLALTEEEDEEDEDAEDEEEEYLNYKYYRTLNMKTESNSHRSTKQVY